SVYSQQMPHKIITPPSYPAFSIGLIGGVNVNVHNGNFQTTQLYVCEQFQNGVGPGAFMGIEGVYNTDKVYSILLRAGFSNYYASFTSGRGQVLIKDSLGDYLSEYTWKPSLSYISIEPLFGFTPYNTHLRFAIGPTLNFLASKKFTEQNDIVTADGPTFTFEDGTNTRIVAAGDLVDMRSFLLGLQTNISYEFMPGGNVIISPYMSAHYLLQSPTPDYKWNIFTLQAGVSLRFITGFKQ
ncbi:MAG TPA: hypothetical protein VFA55_06665, partial [Candidatus Kapabacteria bacterium]|nr:hypothetical protein [Candidatus Kapabacteria bacterium]